MANKTVMQKVYGYLAKVPGRTMTAPELARAVKSNEKTVRNVLGMMDREDWQGSVAGVYISEDTRKCRVTGTDRHTYMAA